MNGTPCEFHQWHAVEGWGVIIGVSRCRRCGKLSRTEDFPALRTTDSTRGGDMTVARDQLKSIVERIERLHEEKAAISEDIREIYVEAKANGFDAKALRHVVKLRGQDTAERQEFEAIVEMYMHALGMLPDAGTESATYARPARPSQTPISSVSGVLTESAAHSAETSAATDSQAKADDEAAAKCAGGEQSNDGTPSDEARPAESVSRPSRGGGAPAPVSASPFRPDLQIPAQMRRA